MLALSISVATIAPVCRNIFVWSCIWTSKNQDGKTGSQDREITGR
jgi:hypothetical protein